MSRKKNNKLPCSGQRLHYPLRNIYACCFQVEKEMADVVGQAEEKERRLNKSRKKLERKLVGFLC